MKTFFKAFWNVLKKLSVAYVIGTILIFCFMFLSLYSEEAVTIEQVIKFLPFHIIISFLMSFLMITFFCAPFLQLYFMIKLGNKVIDNIDSSEHKGVDKNIYYRDLPTDYNPAIASLILNKWFEKKVDMTSMILYLIKKDYLKKDGEKVIYTGKDMTDLPESEKYLVNYYAKNEVAFDFYIWKNIVVREAVDKGYAKRISIKNYTEEETKEFEKKAKIVVALIFIIPFLLIMLNLYFIMFFISTVGIPFAVVTLIVYAYRRANVNVELTKKGIEEQGKLVKLRKFLEDFSSLDEYNEEAVELWEDYLIYAISLGVNTDIVEKSKIYNKLNYGYFRVNQELATEIYNGVNEKFNIDARGK